MENHNVFDWLLLFLLAMTLWIWVLSGPQAHSEEAKRPPKEDWIPYCWSEQHNVYLPCMYSKKVHKA